MREVVAVDHRCNDINNLLVGHQVFEAGKKENFQWKRVSRIEFTTRIGFFWGGFRIIRSIVNESKFLMGENRMMKEAEEDIRY